MRAEQTKRDAELNLQPTKNQIKHAELMVHLSMAYQAKVASDIQEDLANLALCAPACLLHTC